MIRIYPLNDRILAEMAPPIINFFTGQGTSETTITVTWDSPNEEGKTFAQIIRPSHGTPIPWQMGVLDCQAQCTLPDADQNYQYSADRLVELKHPKETQLPYVNGYLCIQDAIDHAVVFYNGFLIYDGKYTANGYALKFAYGDEYCLGPGCCPMHTTTEWKHSTYVKWKKNDDGKFISKSKYDEQMEQRIVDEEGNAPEPVEPNPEDYTTGTFIPDCSYEVEYVLKQTITIQRCEPPVAQVKRKMWWFGSSGQVTEVQCSVWKEEYCHASLPSMPDRPYSAPRCNSCATDEATETDPIWKHVPKEECTPSPAQEEEGMKLEVREKCHAEVAQVIPTALGGRIFPLINAGGEISKWAYIFRDYGYCRMRKDYTVIGEIDTFWNLPGFIKMGNTQKLEDAIVSRDVIDGFLIHAPKDFYGDYWDTDRDNYEYPSDYNGPQLSRQDHNARLKLNDAYDNGEDDAENFEEKECAPIPPELLRQRAGDWKLEELNYNEARWSWEDEESEPTPNTPGPEPEPEDPPFELSVTLPAPRPYEVNDNNEPLEEGVIERWEFLEVTGTDDNRKLKFRHKVLNWGDIRGPILRKGIKAGDVFYHIGSDWEEERTRDKYWYWTGYGWKEGSTAYSKIGSQWSSTPEIALFYEATGIANLADEQCGQAKALYIGKYGSLMACRNLLAVNLGTGADYHKALYWDNKLLWERPASSGNYVADDGEAMQEGVVCAGEYILCTYNVGHNTQKLQVWMIDYTRDFDNQEATVVEHYEGEWDYDSIPNIWALRTEYLYHDYARDKYGQAAAKNYLILPSRDSESLYVFYRLQLVNTYEKPFADQATICGPIYAVVYGLSSEGYAGNCNGNNGVDVYYNGSVAMQACAAVRFDGAVLDFGVVERNFFMEVPCGGALCYTNYNVNTSLSYVVAEGKPYTSVVGTHNYGNYASASTNMWVQRSGGIGGLIDDWAYFPMHESQVGDTNSTESEVEVCEGQTVTVTTDITSVTGAIHVYRINKATQVIEHINAITTDFIPEGRDLMEVADPASEVTVNCPTGAATVATHIIRYYFGPSFYLNFSNSWNNAYGGGGGSTITSEFGPGGWWTLETITCANSMGSGVGHCSGCSHSIAGYATHFVIGRHEGLIIKVQRMELDGYEGHPFPSLCTVEDETPEDPLDNTMINIFPEASFIIGGSGGGTAGNIPCIPSEVLWGICEGESWWYCSCDSIWKAHCGRFITQTTSHIAENISTHMLFFDGILIASEQMTSCCGNYAITDAEGSPKLYYHLDNLIVSISKGDSFGSCCVDGTILNQGNSASLLLKGEQVWTKPRYNQDNDEWHISCCGRDYYLVQRGSFKKEKAGYHIEEQHSSQTNGVETQSWQSIDKGSSYGTLEDGTVISLKDIVSFEWQTKPDPLSGTYSKHHVEYPKTWEVSLPSKGGPVCTFEVPHDITYTFQGPSSSPNVKEERTNYIPWKYEKTARGREAYVYYLTKQICDDPRVSSIECFREYDTQTPEGIIAEGCFATFYDDPYHNVTKQFTFNKRSEGDDLGGGSDITEHYKYQSAVKNPMPLYSPDEHDFNGCDCEDRSLVDAAFPNIGLYVWIGDTCYSKCDHSKDEPRLPFYNGPEADFETLRGNCMYIADYNTGTRFDRLSDTDPVDHTIHNDWPNTAPGPGDGWLAPPTHSIVPISNTNIGNIDQIDLSGRLVTSGNYTLMVWDKKYGTLEFNMITGARIARV
jgi:hypothetical protein